MIGLLTKRITLQYATRSSDGMGGVTLSWVDYATVFAAIWPLSANEYVANKAVQAKITHRIRIRYRSAMTHDMRVTFGNRVFEIKGIINNNESNIYLDLMCEEKTN